LFSLNIITTSDQIIQTTNAITLPANPPKLTFQGYINAEPTWDGGVVEISTDGGSTWTDLGSRMISGGYNGSLSSSGANPIRGQICVYG
jgi:extracellular elastinolytic metalloproteinase